INGRIQSEIIGINNNSILHLITLVERSIRILIMIKIIINPQSYFYSNFQLNATENKRTEYFIINYQNT
ncbi:hypothetical protein J7L48_09100, partial [bacterium]|nr:hypothetical protein [bacterium]